MMMRLATLTAAAVALASASALAQAPRPLTLTYSEIQGLSAGLNALDAGSVDQCSDIPVRPLPKAGSPQPPPTQPCPYVKSVPLLVAMARDMRMLEGPLAEINRATNALRTQILGAPRAKGDDLSQVQARQSAEFANKVQDIMDTKVTLPDYAPITLGELNLGTPPGQNRLSATILSQLAPVVPDLHQK